MERGVQGIIVSGEASESDEEEEFCAAQVKVAQRAQQIRAESCPSSQPKLQRQQQQQQRKQQQQRIKRTYDSILHQKLWEANAALERDLAQCIRGPLREQSGRIQHLSGTLSTIQTSTLTTYNSLTQASRNLYQIDFLLAGLADNPLASMKILR